MFLEIQVRAALEGVDMQGPARVAVAEGGRAARRVAPRAGAHGGGAAHSPRAVPRRRAPRRRGRRSRRRADGAQLGAAYQILEVDPKATDEEVAKAYRRQLSKHHPDKLKANGLPDSMLEHAKQRTQQIIEAYELIKSARQRVNCVRHAEHPGSRRRFCPRISRASATRSNAVLAAGADIVHFDVMDNHYVPNLTIGPLVCEALRKHGITAPIDVHLMVKPVDRIIPDFAKAGATYISFHPEASEHVDRTIELIRENGCKPGLVFNPATPLDCLDHTLNKLDLVLLMSVNPGFGGQKFIPGVLDKVRAVRKLIDATGTADPARGRRRREGRQHRRDRARRRRHVRRRLGDLRREGLQGDHRRDARRDRRQLGADRSDRRVLKAKTPAVSRRSAMTHGVRLLIRRRPRRHHHRRHRRASC